MFLHVEPANGVAVYEQIVRQVKYAIAAGVLREGELVPSVRELARELGVNPNTVARAYRQLQDESVLAPVRGTGLSVTVSARRACRDARKDLLAERMGQVLEEAVRSGLSLAEIERMFQSQLRQVRIHEEHTT